MNELWTSDNSVHNGATGRALPAKTALLKISMVNWVATVRTKVSKGSTTSGIATFASTVVKSETSLLTESGSRMGNWLGSCSQQVGLFVGMMNSLVQVILHGGDDTNGFHQAGIGAVTHFATFAGIP